MKNYSKKLLLANAFGTLGYLSCLLLWAWTAILYLPIILANDQVKQLLIPPPAEETATPAISVAPSPATLIFALVTTIVILAITVFALLRVPVAIAKTGKTITTKAADSAVPLVSRGKPLPEKEKRRLTAQLTKLMKLLLVLLPIATLCLSMSIEFALSFELAILVASALAIAALFWFSLQYLLARALNLNFERLV